jgi:phage terminase large subunit-like protein
VIDSVTKRWIKSEADEIAVHQGCYFDQHAADHVEEFFRRFLRHSKGRWGGKPFELIDWQRDDLIFPIFGWKLPDGRRRIRKVYCEVPKKQGKSTICSGVGLYMLVGDGEPGAEVYSAATDQNQAGIVHGEAINMVDASPELSALIDINRSTKTITFPHTKSVYKALSSDAHSKEGLNASCIIADELHVWRGRVFWDALKYAFAAREQPLLFMITTAGDDTLSVCYEQRTYAKQVASGEVQDLRFHSYIAAAEADDDWTDEKTWFKANPSLGQTQSLDDFRADFEEALKTPTTQSSFKRYRLNIWATGSNPWLSYHQWQACGRKFHEEDLLGCPCFGGLDLARIRDMTAFVLWFPKDDGNYVLPYFWMPEATINRTDSPEYLRAWVRDGLLISTPGEVCDYNFVREHIVKLSQQFDLRAIYFDPYNAEQLTQELDEEYGIPRYAFGQSKQNFTAPVEEFERLIVSQQVFHNNHAILNWQAGHVEVKEDATGKKQPVKPKRNDPRKIDGIVAAVMGLAGALELGADTTSVYDNSGVVVF